jgi:hypothetical protein
MGGIGVKNLQERILGSKHWMYCPLTGERCAYEANSGGAQPFDCAHYDPEQEECIHVLAAQAQAAIAKALLPVAAVESEHAGDIRQAAEWLNRGEFVRREAWQTNDGSAMRLTLPIGGNYLCLQVGQGPRRDCVEWIPGAADLLATDWVVDRE